MEKGYTDRLLTTLERVRLCVWGEGGEVLVHTPSVSEF